MSIPAGVLKIDRSLISGLDDGAGQSAAAVAAVVGLGAGLRHAHASPRASRPREQLALAAELGCTFAQGFHIARPMPADELPAWLSTRRRARAPRPRRGALVHAGR